MAREARQLDGRVEVVTPENIAFTYQVAGPFLRLPAYLIDLVLRVVVVLLVGLLLALTLGNMHLGAIGFGVWFLLWFVLDWFYGGLFETFWNGQTPGKRLVGIRVLTVDGQPINGFQAVLRNVLRAVDCQPLLCYLVGLVACALNDRFQRLGDLVCGTMVVVDRQGWLRGVVRTRDKAVLALAEQLPPSLPLSRTTARALAAYAQRRNYFSAMRRREIAQHLADVFRRQWNLPATVDADQLLCAVYHRAFVGRAESGGSASVGASPFAAAPEGAAAP